MWRNGTSVRGSFPPQKVMVEHGGLINWIGLRFVLMETQEL
jgi:hypothetical protein